MKRVVTRDGADANDQPIGALGEAIRSPSPGRRAMNRVVVLIEDAVGPGLLPELAAHGFDLAESEAR